MSEKVVMSKKFTKKDGAKLEKKLRAVGEHSMCLSELEGFLSALICCPETIKLSEYLPYIHGDDHDFRNEENLRDFLELHIKLWNQISGGFKKSLENVESYHMPSYIDEGKDGENHTTGTLWAVGFMKGVSLRKKSWSKIINDEDFGGAILPIIVLAGQNHHDLKLRTDKIPYDKEPEFIGVMVAGLNVTYKYFEKRRDEGMEDPSQKHYKVNNKEGRNDPCPCGSGIKYKKCCLNKDKQAIY